MPDRPFKCPALDAAQDLHDVGTSESVGRRRLAHPHIVSVKDLILRIRQESAINPPMVPGLCP